MLPTHLLSTEASEKVSFIAAARSLNEQDLRTNLEFLKVPQAGNKTIRSKLAMKIFEEYTNTLKVMYSTRFNWRFADRETKRRV